MQVWDDELARVTQKWADQCTDMSDMYPCVQVWDDELARVAQKWATSAQT